MDSNSFQPPKRSSLTDEELEARVNQAMTERSGVEGVMELLVAQESLRAIEQQEQESWEAQMQAIGSEESIAALQRFRGASSPGKSHEDNFASTQQSNIEAVATNNEAVEIVAGIPKQPATQSFSWLNPAPPKPAQVVQPDSTPQISEIVIEEPEVVEEVIEISTVDEDQVDEPKRFDWLSKPEIINPVKEEIVPEAILEEIENVVSELLVAEEEVVSDPHPVGLESETEFEQLLAAAAAEEELTALEESKRLKIEVIEVVEPNVIIPSDEHRNRGPVSQLFIWLGVSATLVPILLTWTLIGLGLNTLAVVGALVAGYLVSGILIATSSLSGKRSGLSTAVISRSSFGVWGNSIPLSLMLTVRLTLTATIVATFAFLMNGADQRLPEFSNELLNLVGLKITTGFAIQIVLLLLVAALVAIRGNVVRVIQLLMSLVAFVLVAESFASVPSAGFSFTTAGNLGITSLEALSGFAIVVLVNLVLWFAIAPNLSKAIPMKVRGAKVFSAVLVANFVFPLIVGALSVVWLGSISVSNPSALATIQTAVSVLPVWAQGSLTSGVAIALVFAAMLSLRSATLDFASLFRSRSRVPALLVSVVGVSSLLLLFTQQPTSQEVEYLSKVFIFASAISAGWIGIYTAEVLIRKRAYHELSLVRPYGVYKKFNILSLIIWTLTLASAVALIPVNLLGFGFMGFALPMLGFEASLGSAALGFLISVVLGLVLTIGIRIPQIKKQEVEVLELEARKEQLNDIFVGNN
jgi:purine-cytosine permease-like protein